MNRTRRSNPRALTLIELLAVVVILALVSMLGMARLASMDDAAKVERFIFEWRELDARARILAPGSSPGSERIPPLQLQVRTNGLILRAGDTTLGAARIERDALTCRLRLDEREVTAIEYDTRGCSQDYALIVQSADKVERWSVAGETGWIERRRGNGGGS